MKPSLVPLNNFSWCAIKRITDKLQAFDSSLVLLGFPDLSKTGPNAMLSPNLSPPDSCK